MASAPYIIQQEEVDAIVVGSGISGGWAAKELCEKGLNTLVLERGRHVEHGTDYVTEHMPPWEMDLQGEDNLREIAEEYPMQSQGPLNPYTKHFYVKDSEHPYLTEEGKPYLWIRGYHLGGRSITWGRQVYRWSDLDFTANLREGIAVDWPIRYDDVKDWYTYVERFIGVTGQAEGLAHLPDGDFLPPMEMTCVEAMAKERVEAAFPERKIIHGRAAILTVPHNGRAACHYCGPCDRGCSTASYFSSLGSTLPAAEATGNLTIQTDAIVHSIIYDAQRGRAVGVRVVDRLTNEMREYYSRLVFLCASCLGSTQILLNSTSPTFPNGLGNSSGVLGHYLMDHHFRAGATATFDGFEERYTFGQRPNGTYIPRFRNISPETKQQDFLRGYGYEAGASRASWQRATHLQGFGAAFKHAMRDPGRWSFWMTAFGETLPRYENYVELDPDVKDQWGIPVLKFHADLGPNEEAMREDMAIAGAEMLEAAGGKNVTPYIDEYKPGEGIHEMGTARMGRDPATSILNGHNQIHSVPNVFVTDGACMTSSSCQNPSITYMTLTARAVDYAVQEMNRGNL
ncbi:MAG: GMC family oxidoreductase [Rhodothermales bacterium]